MHSKTRLISADCCLRGFHGGILFCAVTFAVAFSFASLSHADEPVAEQEVVDIGDRRELFVDRYLISDLSNASLILHRPHDEGPVLQFDRRWEGGQSGYVTMIRKDNGFRMYYRGISEQGLDGSDHERTCIAESDDGIHWTKPVVGLYEFNGSRDNNIVLANAAPSTHNFCPFVDLRPGVPVEERYKAVGGTGSELHAWISPDGLQWVRLQEEPILSGRHMPFPFTHLFDSQNLVFWSESEQLYVCYFRVWDGVRRIARSTSQDFRTWSSAEMMTHWHDSGDGPQPAAVEHLYTSQTSPYFRAPHIYLAVAARFFEGRQVLTTEQATAIGVDPKYFGDTSDAVLMSTRGGSRYDRTFMEGFLRPGIGPENWVSRTNYPALNLLQTSPVELSLYVNQNYAQPTAHVRRYSLRLDGFSSLHAGAAEGIMSSRILHFTGDRLSINFSTSAGGGVKIELQDPDGTPYPGFSLDDCREQIGNEIDRTVLWNGRSDLSAVQGKSVRMKIVLRDADLYSFQFASNK
ncbi:MAG: hypothetical protein JNL58_14335 [Planctomyces sp.]|nr:hypothetical protein [Planctomyces sp.]